MTNGRASEDAVRAALDSLVSDFSGGYIDADDPSDVLIDIGGFDLISAVRAALEAAAPYMRSSREEPFDVPTEPDDGLLGWVLDNRATK